MTAAAQRPAGWVLSVVPNLADWQLGDIVLMSARGAAGGLLQAGQTALLPQLRAHANWVHCGIYAGNGKVIDALPDRGVQARSLAAYARHRSLQVKRLKIGADLLADDADGREIVQAARTMLHASYAWQELTRDCMHLALRRVGLAGLSAHVRNRFYCSALVVRAYVQGARVNLDDDQGQPCLPSTLSAHPDLRSIPVHWVYNGNSVP